MNGQDLKNSILQLAMQGKLVEQRQEEGTGEELYQQIQEEKKKLISEGKLKKENPLPEINKEEIPFEIPKSWKWVKFGNCVNFYMGKTPPRAETKWWNGKFPWVSIADMPENGHVINTKECVSAIAVKDIFTDRISPKGTLLMSFKLTVGRVSILDVDAVHNEAIISINTHQDKSWFIKNYLFYVLPKITNYGDSKDAIKGKTLNKTSINNLLIPLPPYNEIGRIVCKLKEVLPFVEEYGKLEREREDLDVELPEKLKKSILQYAMQGKLVPQIPSEGTAEELYTKIQEEKQKLIEQSKLKKEKPLPPITEDEIPFQIPPTWKWVRLNDLVSKSIKRGKSPKYVDKSETLVFAQKCNSKYDGIRMDLAKYLNEDLLPRYDKNEFMKDNDIVINSTGEGTLGRIGIYKTEDSYNKLKVVPDSHVTVIRALNLVSVYYCYYCLKWLQPTFEKLGEGSTKQTELSAKTLKETNIPLPPLKEQNRIVSCFKKLIEKIDNG